MDFVAVNVSPRQLPLKVISADSRRRLRRNLPAPRVAAATLLGLVAWLVGAGCRSSEALATRSQGSAEPPFVFALHGDFPPNLGTNEVMQIALSLAGSRHIRLADYACASLVYWGNTTNTWLTNKWIAAFHETPPVPDSGFSVIIDDSTRQADLWRR
jgi:hypothetical protein